jgi:hypothetical protein
MSLSGKGCEKCNGKGCVPFSDDAPRSVMRPCGACSEPWGPQWLDAPDGDGFWWMLVKGGTPEPVRVQQMRPPRLRTRAARAHHRPRGVVAERDAALAVALLAALA